MNAQELFDKVVLALQAQKRKSVDQGRCVYRAPDGAKCAAGHLIADEHYRPAMEGSDCYSGSVSRALVESGVPHQELPLVAALQYLHDAHMVREWPERLRGVARNRKLSDEKVRDWTEEEFSSFDGSPG